MASAQHCGRSAKQRRRPVNREAASCFDCFVLCIGLILLIPQPAEWWAAIFPEKQVTETQSMLFVKKLLAVAVSSVTYLRAIFPENAFGDRSLEDLRLKILREDNSCPGACQVIQWMKGCFDALDKKFLRMILIGIYENPEDPDTVIEQYTFKFNYNGQNGVDIYRNDKKIIGATTEEQTKKATIRLLRTLILLSQTLSPLPDDVMMTMKLFYYDEVTPTDYQPPGFKECAADPFAFKEEAMNIRVGEVATPFHAMTLKLGTIHHQLKYADEQEAEQINGQSTAHDKKIPVLEEREAIADIEIEEEEQFEEVPDTSREAQENNDGVIDEEELPETTQKIPESFDKIQDNDDIGEETPMIQEENSPVEEEPTVHCHCGVNEDDGLMILCAVCETWQHALCFAILDAENAPASHICATCSSKFDDQRCTDPRLERLSVNEIQATCIWRRTLIATSEMNRVTGNILAKRLGTDVNIANQLIKRLEKESFIKTTSKNKRLGRLVNKEKILSEGIDYYFKNEDGDDISTATGNENIDPNVEESVASIVTRASQLELAEKRQEVVSKEAVLEKEMLEIKSILMAKGNARKRAVSRLNEDDEFEISDSQDVNDIPGENRLAKRSKASAAVHSLLV